MYFSYDFSSSKMNMKEILPSLPSKRVENIEVGGISFLDRFFDLLTENQTQNYGLHLKIFQS